MILICVLFAAACFIGFFSLLDRQDDKNRKKPRTPSASPNQLDQASWQSAKRQEMIQNRLWGGHKTQLHKEMGYAFLFGMLFILFMIILAS